MTVAGILSAIVVGLIIGALGRLVLPGRQNIPIWLTMVVGIVAALLGTAIARGAGLAETAGVDWVEILIQVALAAVGVALVAGLLIYEQSLVRVDDLSNIKFAFDLNGWVGLLYFAATALDVYLV